MAVFLSYAREDIAAAELVAKALRAGGYEVWWDRQLHGGTEYSIHIERVLAECHAVVVLWSRNSVASPWVRDEAAVGRDQGKLIPASLDGSEAPIGFRQYHTIALRDWVQSRSRRVPASLHEALGQKVDAIRERNDETNHVPDHKQEVKFCQTPDGVCLAYSRIGNGPPMVKTANWLNHLELELESPIWGHWFRGLSQFRTLVRYDARGNGMSDWEVRDLTFGAMVSDVATVVDAAEIESFDLIGISQGVPVAVAYAAKYPERVKRMVLVGGFAVGWANSQNAEAIKSWEAMVTLVKTGWGKDNAAFREMLTSMFFPEATPEEVVWWNKLQKASASPEGAHKLIRLLGDIDVRRQLPRISVPTMVMHTRDDAVVPFEAARTMAAQIPGARFIPLDDRSRLLTDHEAAWHKALQHVRNFLAD